MRTSMRYVQRTGSECRHRSFSRRACSPWAGDLGERARRLNGGVFATTIVSITGLLLMPAALGVAGPIDGQMSLQRQIGAATEEGPTPFEMSFTFRGGQRACVVAQGDHDPV